MRKFILFTLFLLISMVGFSQSYIGWVNKQVNFREGPGTENSIIKSLKPGTQIFIVSTTAENNYLNIIDIETNKEGYVHKSYIRLGEVVEKNEGGIFTPSGKSDNYKPEIEIYNNTNITLTLKLNSQLYTFRPQEKQSILLSPGSYNYRASAPGVIPNIGIENMQSNMNYSWQFYIVTQSE